MRQVIFNARGIDLTVQGQDAARLAREERPLVVARYGTLGGLIDVNQPVDDLSLHQGHVDDVPYIAH